MAVTKLLWLNAGCNCMGGVILKGWGMLTMWLNGLFCTQLSNCWKSPFLFLGLLDIFLLRVWIPSFFIVRGRFTWMHIKELCEKIQQTTLHITVHIRNAKMRRLNVYSHCVVCSIGRRHYKQVPRWHYVSKVWWCQSGSLHNRCLLAWRLTKSI